LARYNVSEFHLHIKTGIYFILHPITYQNFKTKLKNVCLNNSCLHVQIKLKNILHMRHNWSKNLAHFFAFLPWRHY